MFCKLLLYSVERLKRLSYFYLFGLIATLWRTLRGVSTILDVGCGEERPIKTLKEAYNRTFGYSVGLDLRVSVASDAKKVYDDFVVADAVNLPFRKQSFDATIAIELIEHLTKNEGYKLIEELHRVSKKVIVVTTPSYYFYVPPPSGCPIVRGHTSYWTLEEFKVLGFSVRGERLRAVSGKRGALASLTRTLFGPVSYIFPRLGARIIAFKKLSNR